MNARQLLKKLGAKVKANTRDDWKAHADNVRAIVKPYLMDASKEVDHHDALVARGHYELNLAKTDEGRQVLGRFQLKHLLAKDYVTDEAQYLEVKGTGKLDGLELGPRTKIFLAHRFKDFGALSQIPLQQFLATSMGTNALQALITHQLEDEQEQETAVPFLQGKLKEIKAAEVNGNQKRKMIDFLRDLIRSNKGKKAPEPAPEAEEN